MVDLQPHHGSIYLIRFSTDIADPLQQRLGVLHQENVPLVDDDDFLQYIGSFLNDVSRDDESAASRSIFLQQQLVELLPGHHVQSRHRLIQKRIGRLGAHSYDDGHHGQHALGQLPQFFLPVQLKKSHQPLLHVLIPVGIVSGGNAQVLLDLDSGDAALCPHVQFPGKAQLLQGFPVFPHWFSVY